MANSNPMKPEKKKVNKCEVAAVVSILLCLIAVEVIMPIGICPGAVLDNVVKLRTAEGISKRTETETVSTKYFHVYNLTNAYALQTQTPAPTPVFVEVKVPYTYRFREYDPTFSGDEYTMSVWMHHSPVLASDLDQIIIVPNVALITFLTAIGGEAVLPFIPGGAAIQGMLTADAMGLKPDGSGAFNAGLFTRRTVREVLEGYVDPLLGPIPSPVDPTAATYNTHATLEDQQEVRLSYVGREKGPGWTLYARTRRVSPFARESTHAGSGRADACWSRDLSQGGFAARVPTTDLSRLLAHRR